MGNTDPGTMPSDGQPGATPSDGEDQTMPIDGQQESSGSQPDTMPSD